MAVTITWNSSKFGTGATGGGMPGALYTPNPSPASHTPAGGTTTNAQWETIVVAQTDQRDDLFPQTLFNGFRVNAVLTGTCDPVPPSVTPCPPTITSYTITSDISTILGTAEDCWDSPTQWAIDATATDAGITENSYLKHHHVFNQYDYRYLTGDPSDAISTTPVTQKGGNSDTGSNCDKLPETPFTPTTDADTKPEMPYNAIYRFYPDDRVYVTVTYTVTVTWSCLPCITTPQTDTLIIKQHFANGHFPPHSPGEYGSLARFYIDQSYFYDKPSDNRYGWNPGKWIYGA
jgi:hypothetical protein